MKTGEFEVKEEHIKLIQHFSISYECGEVEAPAVDLKRPYGNGCVISDIANILGINPIDKNHSDYDPDYDDYTEDQEIHMMKLHEETTIALQILCQNLSIEPGLYIQSDYDKWERQ